MLRSAEVAGLNNLTGIAPRSQWIVFLSISTIALLVITFSMVMNQQFYKTHLSFSDGMGIYFSVGRTIQIAKTQGTLQALNFAVNSSMYILHQIMAALLGPLLNLSMSVGPLFNGIWYLAMSVSLGLLFWDRTHSIVLSILLSIPPMIYISPVATAYEGLTNMNVDFLSYVLSVSTICYLLLSDNLSKSWATILAGVFWGLLVLGRIPTAILLGIMVMPLFIKGLIYHSTRSVVFRGLLILGTTVLMVSGWWLIFSLYEFIKFFFFWYGHPLGSMGNLSPARLPFLWKGFIRELIGNNIPYIGMTLWLSWIPGSVIIKGVNGISLLKQLNWIYIWMGISPLLILMLLHTENLPYAFPAYMGFYLTLLFPFKQNPRERSILQSKSYRMGLMLMIIIASFWFVITMYKQHTTPSFSKQTTLQITQSILDDIYHQQADKDKQEFQISITYWGTLNRYSLANVFLFDKNQSVRMIGKQSESNLFKPSRPPILHIHSAVAWLDASDSDETHKAYLNKIVEEVENQSDYVIILSRESWNPKGSYPFSQFWSQWVKLSEQLLNSNRFHTLTLPLRITDSEWVVVLARSF
ncbi:MAG TPA: hypothetical protein VNM22_06495 [Candidatus Limnocylindrales bacterium]|nr:hypothetical protein [Candidatus Limnocylindrales bacterium]